VHHLREVSTIGDYAQHLAADAAAVALVTPEAEEDWRREGIAFDLGHAAQNMMLCAWQLGIASVHAAVYDEGRARDSSDIRRGPAATTCCRSAIRKFRDAMRSPLRAGGRRALEEALHRERW
jgi:hypothetical protein